jgi:hypothetical protein
MDFLLEGWVYLIVGIIFLYILSQSVYFLIKAYKEARRIGFSNKQLRETISSSMIFSIAPSVAILIGLVALSKVLGPLFASMRLGTLGAVTYELPTTQLIVELYSVTQLTPGMVVTILWVLTLGCIPPLLIIPIFFQKWSGKLDSIKKKDNAWTKIMMDALFIGMISAFVGLILAKKVPEVGDPYFSFLSLMVFFTSAILIVIFGLLIKKLNWQWLKNYALPLSMILSMAIAILYASMGVR